MTAIATMLKRLETRQISSVELVSTALKTADDYSNLNAFISLDREGALFAATEADKRWKKGAARPLEGIPISVKDNIAVAGQPLTGGSLALGNQVPAEDAATVKHLRDAGAIIIGKTNLHELAFGVTSNNGAFGAVHNPSAPGYSPGGSSGGAAAAVAVSIVPAGLATDTGGSGRIPAAFCGCTGFRPTTGRYPVKGVMQLTWTFDSAAVIAGSVADVRLLDAVLSSSQAVPKLPPPPDQLKLGIPRSSFADGLAPQVQQAFDGAIQALISSGVTLVDVNLDEVLQLDAASSFAIAMFEAGQLWHSEIQKSGMSAAAFIDNISSPDVRALLATALNGTVTPPEYAKAMSSGLTPLRSTYSSMFAAVGVDAVVFPTVHVPPPLMGENETVMIEGHSLPLFPTIVRNASPGALGALPGLSIPFGTMQGGVPFGLEIDGPTGKDEWILAIGVTLERIGRAMEDKR